MINWKKTPHPIIALAPMADFTDKPFSLMCKKFDAQVIFREMVSADAIVHSNLKTLKMIAVHKKERPVIQQIFGHDPQTMARAAEIIYKLVEPDGIDINMGCPAPKLIKNFHGCALMKEPDRIIAIIKAVKTAVPCPVSVKTRLGWSKPDEILKIAPIIEQAGADLISLHGRTKTQGYAGIADWEMIGRVKKIISSPLLANGSIFEVADIEKCLDITKADGVLIARGALGNPWIFHGIDKSTLSVDQIKKTILEHAELQAKNYGDYGLVLFRKHLMFYLKGLAQTKELKTKLTQIENLDQLKKILLAWH
ncbi:MAG TPA: tRNA-dihydrouridine synthase family protein [Candidatus Magasanikbacteria bacterium]|nr:tRNA-dihydrouridine synthase family protein [Candidatus Magasanikbacteria bacterium]